MSAFFTPEYSSSWDAQQRFFEPENAYGSYTRESVFAKPVPTIHYNFEREYLATTRVTCKHLVAVLIDESGSMQGFTRQIRAGLERNFAESGLQPLYVAFSDVALVSNTLTNLRVRHDSTEIPQAFAAMERAVNRHPCLESIDVILISDGEDRLDLEVHECLHRMFTRQGLGGSNPYFCKGFVSRLRSRFITVAVGHSRFSMQFPTSLIFPCIRDAYQTKADISVAPVVIPLTCHLDVPVVLKTVFDMLQRPLEESLWLCVDGAGMPLLPLEGAVTGTHVVRLCSALLSVSMSGIVSHRGNLTVLEKLLAARRIVLDTEAAFVARCKAEGMERNEDVLQAKTVVTAVVQRLNYLSDRARITQHFATYNDAQLAELFTWGNDMKHVRSLAKALDHRKLDFNATLSSLESFLGAIAAGTVRASEDIACVISMETQQEMLRESAAAFAPPNPPVLAMQSMAEVVAALPWIGMPVHMKRAGGITMNPWLAWVTDMDRVLEFVSLRTLHSMGHKTSTRGVDCNSLVLVGSIDVLPPQLHFALSTYLLTGSTELFDCRAPAAIWAATMVHMLSDAAVGGGELPDWVRKTIGEFGRMYEATYEARKVITDVQTDVAEPQLRSARELQNYIAAAFGSAHGMPRESGASAAMCPPQLAVFSTSLADESRAELRCHGLTQYLFALIIGIVQHGRRLTIGELRNRFLHALAELCYRSPKLQTCLDDLQPVFEASLSRDRMMRAWTNDPVAARAMEENGFMTNDLCVEDTVKEFKSRVEKTLHPRANGSVHPLVHLVGVSGVPSLYLYQLEPRTLANVFVGIGLLCGMPAYKVLQAIQPTRSAIFTCVFAGREHGNSMMMHEKLGLGNISLLTDREILRRLAPVFAPKQREMIVETMGRAVHDLCVQKTLHSHLQTLIVPKGWVEEMKEFQPDIEGFLELSAQGLSLTRCMSPHCQHFLHHFGPARMLGDRKVMALGLERHLQASTIPGTTRIIMEVGESMPDEEVAALILSGTGLRENLRANENIPSRIAAGVKKAAKKHQEAEKLTVIDRIQKKHKMFSKLAPDYLLQVVKSTRAYLKRPAVDLAEFKKLFFKYHMRIAEVEGNAALVQRYKELYAAASELELITTFAEYPRQMQAATNGEDGINYPENPPKPVIS